MSRKKAAAGRGTIGQRADGLWRASVMVDGRRRYVSAKTEREALVRLDALRATLAVGVEPAPAQLTVARFLDRWIETAGPALRPGTRRSYEGHVRLYINPAIGRVPLSKLTPAQVQKLLTDLQARGLSPATVSLVRATLRRALGQAERWGLVARNVARLVDPPRAERSEIRPLSEDQVRTFLEATRETREWPLYVLAISTGLRQGELLGLRWTDLDLDAGTMAVRGSLQMIDHEPQLVETKTRRSARVVVLPRVAVTALREQRRQQLEDRLAAGQAWEGERWELVFLDLWGEPLRAWRVTKRYQSQLGGAALPRFRFHDLRHTAATVMLSRGVSPRVVMEALGHSTITTTMNIYAHVMEPQQRDAADRMDEALAVR
jgi:integrase